MYLTVTLGELLLHDNTILEFKAKDDFDQLWSVN